MQCMHEGVRAVAAVADAMREPAMPCGAPVRERVVPTPCQRPLSGSRCRDVGVEHPWVHEGDGHTRREERQRRDGTKCVFVGPEVGTPEDRRDNTGAPVVDGTAADASTDTGCRRRGDTQGRHLSKATAEPGRLLRQRERRNTSDDGWAFTNLQGKEAGNERACPRDKMRAELRPTC